MQATRLIFPCVLVSALLVVGIFAQTTADINSAREFEAKAFEAYRTQDFPVFLENMRQAEKLRPNHPRLMFNLAVALARSGNTGEMVKMLDRLTAMGLVIDVDPADPDFQTIDKVKLGSALDRAAVNKKAINASAAAFTLSATDFIPEGLAHDTTTGNFYIGSTHLAKIAVVDKTGKAADFSAPADGLWSVAGMKVDSKRRVLWVCTNAFPQMKGYDKALEGRSGIFKYDLKTGKLLKKYLLPETEKHVLGDLTLDSAGNVYSTDSNSPTIYRITPAADKLEIFFTDPEFISLQGLAFGPKDSFLFVADYSKGIFKIDVAARGAVLLPRPDAATLLGIDGLYFMGGKLVGIQNGVNPQRIIALGLNKLQDAILDAKVLEANHPDFNEPTLGVGVGGDLFYVANSQLNLFTQRAINPKVELKRPVILKVRVN
jgi:hypothetical protein